ncbi:hypothetical protein ACWDCL_11200 [Streptomyces sp. NPDC001009]
MTATQLRLFADYFQLHVMDEDAEDDLGEAWTQEAVSDGIAVSRRTLGIGTAVDMDVTVTVELLDRPPRGHGAGTPPDLVGPLQRPRRDQALGGDRYDRSGGD